MIDLDASPIAALITDEEANEDIRRRIIEYLGDEVGDIARVWFANIVHLVGNDGVPIIVNSQILSTALCSAMGLGYRLSELDAERI